MSGLRQSIRRTIADYSDAFGQSLGQMLADAAFGLLAMAVLSICTVLVLVGAGQ